MRQGLGRLVGSAVLVAGAVLTVPVLLGAPPSADAVPQDAIVVDQREMVFEYGPIAGSNPTRTLLQYPPIYCDTVFATACDTIPVSVVLPEGITEDIGYTSVSISLEWDPGAGPVPDDLDLYLWDDEEIAFAGRSVSERRPEKVNTELREFILVVNHYGGVNTGYQLRFTMNIEIFQKPFELPEPAVPGGGSAGGFGLPTGVTVIDAGPGAGTFGIPEIGAGGSELPTSAMGRIELVPAPRRSVDVDFDEIQRQVREAEQAAAEAPASGGPGAGVWFWLVLLPIAAVGSAGAWLVRRRPASLTR